MGALIDLNGLAHYKSKENAMTADVYSATKTYTVGDYAYYNGTLYRCTTAITTAEAWTAGHWTAAKIANDVSDLKNALSDDENVIGVHRSPTIYTYTLSAFTIPTGTTIKIYTANGEDLPTNRLNLYDVNQTYIDYFTLNSTYGSARTVTFDKTTECKYITLNSGYAKGIIVVWYEDQTILQTVKTLVASDAVNTLKLNSVGGIVQNGYYNYSQWANVSWSRVNTGNRYPSKSTNANRAAFNDLLFVRAGSKIHIEGYSDRKYGLSAWTYDAETEKYTNTVWTSSWLTSSVDWVLAEDSYINVAVANTDDTTSVSLDAVGVVVSVYDSYIALLEQRINNADVQIPSRFATEMETSVASARALLTEPCLVFPLITDIHYAPNTSVFQNFDDSTLLMKKFSEYVSCDFIANLGDNINGSSNQSLMLGYAYHMLASFHKIGLPYMFCIGNHDTNYDPGEKFTIGETFSAFFSGTKGVVYNEATDGTDYYKDIPNLGIRLVYLNTQYLNAYVISSDTVSWFTNIALDTDYTVILFTHQALITTQAWGATVPSNASSIVSAINSFISNGGTLIQFFGHAHADYAFESPWLAIGTTCGKFEQADTSSSGYQGITGNTGSIVSPARTTGDTTEQAWDIVIVRPSAKKVNCVRFGAGSDREFSFGS